jgi:ribosomal protein L32E
MKRVKPRWRKQQGIDNKKRIDRQGYGATPKIGYKNARDVRFMRKDGTFEVLIHNEKELLAIPKDSKHVAVFAHDLSTRKKTFLQKIANQNGTRVINGMRT